MTRHLLLFVFLAIAVALSACAKKHVVTQPEVTQLAPPPPPERVVVPTPDNEPATPPPPSAPEKKGKEGQRNVVRPPVDAPKAVEPPPPPPVQPPEPKKLEAQAPGAAPPQVQVRQAQDLIGQAKNLQDKVSKGKPLSSDAKEQYNGALSLIRQAEAAVSQNPDLAVRLAQNAITILSALANR